MNTAIPQAADNAPASLIDRVLTYNPTLDQDKIARAYEFAALMHAQQLRESGEPYITHPYAVAGILAEMKLDPASIMTALLHDTVEDTKATLDEVKTKFGAEVASLVDGVSKLTRIEVQTVEGKQAENFRKLVLAMSEDIRVLLVKLADRLHNMRTIENTKPEKQRRIARETLDIYAPLAERIGVNTIKEELEDLSFAVLHPEARESITTRLSFLRSEEKSTVQDIITKLRTDMKEAGIEAQVTGREKTRYSIWKKMQRKNVSFEQLSDIIAFRIVVSNVAECYHALGILHSRYPVVPGRFKDYISTPKLNGYRSIHTTVIGPSNQRIEAQIRTHEMHEEADLGVAAHWGYKEGKSPGQMADVKQFRWLRELLDIISQEQRPEDIMENTKLELFQDMVFCFTPKGDLVELPSGATPIDFAYAIHSGVGDRCVGAKINGRIAPLNSTLHNGDQVDIQTSKTGTPNPTWERFVVTGKARSHIRRYIKQQQRDEYLQLGRALLQKIFRQEDTDFTDKATIPALKFYRAETVDDLFVMIGMGHLVARDVYKHLFPTNQMRQSGSGKALSDDQDALSAMVESAQKKKNDKPLPIIGLIPGMAVHYARCCHPVPGDRIVGIVTTGKGVTIHTIECDTLESFADTPERWLDVSWGENNEKANRVSRVNVTIFNRQGALGAVTNIVAKHNGNITNFKITNRTPDFWDLYVDVEVNDVNHLNSIIAALRASQHVSDADRATG